jgi:NAD(P)-dependent dehydrogenase (short-subunit alcohol dehydrogenase family)
VNEQPEGVVTPRRLGDDVVLVTGAASGIGAAIAARLAAEGAAVIVADIHEDAAESVAEQIQQSGGKGLAILTDVTSEEDLSAAVVRTEETFGKMTAIVNNAE